MVVEVQWRVARVDANADMEFFVGEPTRLLSAQSRLKATAISNKVIGHWRSSVIDIYDQSRSNSSKQLS
jgi:hypothetical protein